MRGPVRACKGTVARLVPHAVVGEPLVGWRAMVHRARHFRCAAGRHLHLLALHRRSLTNGRGAPPASARMFTPGPTMSTSMSAVSLGIAVSCFPLVAQQAQFTPIPGRSTVPGSNQNVCILSGSAGYSGVRVSGDGQVVGTVVYTPGFVNGYIPRQAARWTQATGTVVISPDVPGLYPVVGIANDGSSIYGESWRWRAAGGYQDLRPQLSNALGWQVRTIFECSLDGLVIAGIDGIYPSTGDMFRQAIDTGAPQLLPRAAGWPDGYFYFNTLSGDGQVLGGSTRQLATSPFGSDRYAGVVVTPSGAAVITPSGQQAGVTDLNIDGTVAVGYFSLPSNEVRSFRWDSATGLVNLDSGYPQSSGSFARATSLDGSVVVGDYFQFGQPGTRAFLWRATGGFVDLRDELVNNYGLGTQLAGWSLLTATDVSLDGRTIVGQGLSPSGCEQAFLVRFPAVPASATAYGAGCAGSTGQLVLSASSLPYVGQNYAARCTGSSGNALGFSIYGLAQQAVPVTSVLPQGQPGCQLLTTLDLVLLVAPAIGNVFTTNLPIPNVPSLAGAVLQQQFAQCQVDAAGLLQSVATSNGLLLSIGSF